MGEDFNTVFGWGEFRVMENIEWKIGWKTMFSTVWEREENLGEIFLSQAHKFRPPKSGGKA